MPDFMVCITWKKELFLTIISFYSKIFNILVKLLPIQLIKFNQKLCIYWLHQKYMCILKLKRGLSFYLCATYIFLKPCFVLFSCRFLFSFFLGGGGVLIPLGQFKYQLHCNVFIVFIVYIKFKLHGSNHHHWPWIPEEGGVAAKFNQIVVEMGLNYISFLCA